MSLIDFYKAFDSMIRIIIEAALMAWGFSGKILRLTMRLLPATIAGVGVLGHPNSKPFKLIEGGKTSGPLTPLLYILGVFAWLW